MDVTTASDDKTGLQGHRADDDAPPFSGAPAWVVHVVVVIAAGLAGQVVFTALQAHGAVQANAALAVAGGVFLVLFVAHLLLRPRPERIAPALREMPERAARKSAVSDVVADVRSVMDAIGAPARGAVEAPIAPRKAEPSDLALALLADVSAARVRLAEDRQRYRAPQPKPAEGGLEHLQNLVAELARATPGPKATTPDPDGGRVSTSVAAGPIAGSARSMGLQVVE